MELQQAEPRADRAPEGWYLTGRAQIDDRPPVRADLRILPSGTWTARVATFTLAGQVDLMFVADGGGHFCGPAFVLISRANTDAGLKMGTELVGVGPLLVVDPASVLPELPPPDGMVDGEVVDG
jgi:hypothetical protein